VTIAKRFALGKFEVTIEQFSAFVSETGLAAGNKCQVMLKLEADKEIWSRPQASFLQPGFEVTGSHPVVCVSGHEAQAFAAWLRRRTGKAVPAANGNGMGIRGEGPGTTTSYSFGIERDGALRLCKVCRSRFSLSLARWLPRRCGGLRTAPSWKAQAQPVGYRRHARQRVEWVEDCWTPDVRKIPDGRLRLHAIWRLRGRGHSRWQLRVLA